MKDSSNEQEPKLVFENPEWMLPLSTVVWTGHALGAQDRALL